MRIREVVKETGVSRELIHHYLRHGLLPRPERRADYSQQHVLLLRLLKKLREDHHLPLDVIRTVFEIYDFDPARLEPFTLSDSLNNRLTHLTNGGEALSTAFTAGELVRRMGLSPDRLREYVKAKLVRPVLQDGKETYSLYDANIIALCDRGARLGIPLDSLRNISAYVRVAFELEHKFLFEAAGQRKREEKKALGEIVVRQEIVTSLIQNLLQSLIRHRLVDLMELDRSANGTLDDVLFRPSAMFCRRHGLDRAIETAQEQLSAAAADRNHWAHTARLMLHAGRYREATFFLEQALQQWSSEPTLLSLHARALLLSGSHERAAEQLAPRVFSGQPDPVDQAYLALGCLQGVRAAQEALASRRLALPALVQGALEAAARAPWDVRAEVRMLSGWVLHASGAPARPPGPGAALLHQTLAALQDGPDEATGLPGLRERYLLNTAYLLLRCRTDGAVPREAAAPAGGSTEGLRALICRLDPASALAEKVFLEPDAPVQEGGNP